MLVFVEAVALFDHEGSVEGERHGHQVRTQAYHPELRNGQQAGIFDVLAQKDVQFTKIARKQHAQRRQQGQSTAQEAEPSAGTQVGLGAGVFFLVVKFAEFIGELGIKSFHIQPVEHLFEQ